MFFPTPLIPPASGSSGTLDYGGPASNNAEASGSGTSHDDPLPSNTDTSASLSNEASSTDVQMDSAASAPASSSDGASNSNVQMYTAKDNSSSKWTNYSLQRRFSTIQQSSLTRYQR